MTKTNLIQNTDSATARVKDTLHLSFAGLPAEGSMYPDGNRFSCFCHLHTDVNPLTPALNPSAQRCLPKFFTWNFNF
jgi:hypothetical protein